MQPRSHYKIIIICASLLFFLALSHSVAVAKVGSGGPLVPCGIGAGDNCTLCHLVVGIKNIFDWLMGLLFIATVVTITVAGVFYMVSSGNKAMISKAKQAITYALAAFLIGMGCWLMVNVIMTMFGFKNQSWWQFKCDTSSAWGSGSGTDGKKKCSGQCKASCGSDEDKGEGTCDEGKVCCVPKKKCEEMGGECRQIFDPTAGSPCKDDEEEAPGLCQPNYQCCKKKASGKCTGEEGSCGGMKTAVSDQCKLASKNLESLLKCMSSKGAPGTITSVTASNVGSDCDKSYACCGDESCTHATYTCHYGCGMSDQGNSHAVDIGTGGWSDEQLCQLASDAKECGSGTIWGPRNMCGGNIRYQDSHGTHLHISTGACNH